jgi:ribosomal protein S18 acetylase RimI-like enzyme
MAQAWVMTTWMAGSAMTSGARVTYRAASAGDLGAVAQVYMAAFPDSVARLFGRHSPTTRPIADMLQIATLSEPQCAFVAELDGRVVGYCLAPARVSRLQRVFLRHACRFLSRWLTGGYHLGLRPLRVLFLDKIRQLRMRRCDDFHTEAHILSVAVHPDFQARGIGLRLLQAGLEYLAGQHVPAVRLEVRPDNAAAIHLYGKLGFRTFGETGDSQGPWLIMIKRMSGND